MDCLNPYQRHKAMLANSSKDTKIEILLRKALWHEGIRYRKNYKVCSCHPDIVITKYKIAVFCDGERDISNCTKFWHEKIRRNVERDLENTIELRDNGWIVLRFWETEIKKHLADCVAEVQRCIYARRRTIAIRRTRN